MPVHIDIHQVGQSRQVQDPRRLLEMTEGRYRDLAAALVADEKYPAPNKQIEPCPFVVTGKVG